MITCIVGPTASGKSKLAIKIAKSVNGYILNCDSVQIYKNFDIVSDKVTKKERELIHHELIDITTAKKIFTVNDYLLNLNKILKKKKLKPYNPILVGGTGLYYNAFAYQYFFSKQNIDYNYRKKLYSVIDKKGNDYLYNLLKQKDFSSYNKIHKNDTKRIIRALEIYKTTGNNIGFYNNKTKGLRNDIRSFALSVERNFLYEKINKRVDNMIKKGLVNEIKNLLSQDIIKKSILMNIIGYKEIIEYLNNNLSFYKAVELIKQNSRKYCKRQITWFKNCKEIIWLPYNTIKEKKDSKLKIINCILNK